MKHVYYKNSKWVLEIAIFPALKLIAFLICQETKNIFYEAIEKKIEVAADTHVFDVSFILYIQKGYNYTIICHPVGYHNNVINKSILSLFENKKYNTPSVF